MDNTNKIMVIDENGNEKEMQVILTTKLEENGNSYIFYFDPNSSNDNLYVSEVLSDSKLKPIEDQETFKKLEKVINDYFEQLRNQSCSSCQGNCNGDCSDDCGSCGGCNN